MFTGREWLADVQLYDYRNRLYNPDTGRFLQKDPLGFAGGDANILRHCGGDPVNRRDPFGLADSGASYKPESHDMTPEQLAGIPSTEEQTVSSTVIVDGHHDIAIDRTGSAPAGGSLRDTGSSHETLYAQYRASQYRYPQYRQPPLCRIYRDQMPGAPLRDEDRPFQDSPLDELPSGDQIKISNDNYVWFFKQLFEGIFNLFPSVSYDVHPPFAPNPTPGPSGSPSNLPGPHPSSPLPPGG